MTALTKESVIKRLNEMGIFLDPSVVMTMVRHLNKGGKQNQLYPKYASNKTVLKIKKLLDAGELDWMTDELAKRNVLLDSMEKASDEDQERNFGGRLTDGYSIEILEGWEINPGKKDDGGGVFREAITQKAEESIKDFVWSIDNLEGIGIPEGTALGILQEFDVLEIARQSSQHGLSVGESKTTWYLRKFRKFERYLWLHYLVFLMQKYPNSGYSYASIASSLYTRGVVSSDDSIKTAGEDILRYKVGRDGEYLTAYFNSLKRYKRSPKRNREFRDQILSMLGGDYEDGT